MKYLYFSIGSTTFRVQENEYNQIFVNDLMRLGVEQVLGQWDTGYGAYPENTVLAKVSTHNYNPKAKD
jgi:hypothetical protein